MKVLAKGIDVSEMQGRIDWQAVKDSGVEYAILRCGYGQDDPSQDDAEWEYNVAECERVGLPYGAYFFCYARDEALAKGEAAHALRLLSGKTLSYPVYYDMESSAYQGELTAEDYTAIAQTFCETLQAAGYTVGVYANLDWWENRLTAPLFEQFARWIAQYYTRCEYTGSYGMWQYTSSGSVAGISGAVDQNECYVDYPSQIGKSKTVAAAQEQAYIVQAGDTLSEIAERYHTDYQSLADLNGIVNPDLICVGQALRIPQTSAAPAYALGDHVTFSTCYASSSDPISKAIPASQMLRNHGVITAVLSGVRNPYLLDDGLCWVNSGDIRGLFGG